MQLKSWKIITFVTLFFIAFLWIYSQLELSAPGGPHTVSRTIFRWVDVSRPEILTEDPNDVREVIAMVWYPAQTETGVKVGYFPNLASVSQALIQSGEVEWWQVFGLRFIRSESRLNASPQKDQDPFPVVILSPGNGTNIEFYSSLASELASHGYIVVGINHPYDVPAVELSNGHFAPHEKDPWALDSERPQEY